jgi:hypothetical protein
MRLSGETAGSHGYFLERLHPYRGTLEIQLEIGRVEYFELVIGTCAWSHCDFRVTPNITPQPLCRKWCNLAYIVEFHDSFHIHHHRKNPLIVRFYDSIRQV